MAKFVAPVPNVVTLDSELLDSLLQRARAIRAGKVQASSPAEREWAKSITFAETYSMGPRPLKELLLRVPRKTT